VEFTGGYATLKNIAGLAEYLEPLFNRKVDLISVGGLDKYIH